MKRRHQPSTEQEINDSFLPLTNSQYTNQYFTRHAIEDEYGRLPGNIVAKLALGGGSSWGIQIFDEGDYILRSNEETFDNDDKHFMTSKKLSGTRQNLSKLSFINVNLVANKEDAIGFVHITDSAAHWTRTSDASMLNVAPAGRQDFFHLPEIREYDAVYKPETILMIGTIGVHRYLNEAFHQEESEALREKAHSMRQHLRATPEEIREAFKRWR